MPTFTLAEPNYSGVVNLLEALAAIGPRQCGTEAAARAAEAVAEAFRGLGLEPRFEEFPLLGYDAEEPELWIDGERWRVGPCMYSHPGECEGAVRRLSDGVWAVGEGRLLRSLFGKGPIPFFGGSANAGHVAQPPTVFLSRADAERIREGQTARLVVRAEFVPGRVDRNVVAELPGASDEVVVVGAHYDSVWRGPGVIDNATGVEGLRRIAENLAGHGHMRSLIFIAFAAEEIGCIGSRSWIFDSEVTGELGRIKACVNLDCIAHGDRLELMASPKALADRLEGFAGELGLGERYDLNIGPAGPGVDAFPFHEKGIPAATVSHFGYDEYHLPTERLELVDEQRLADSVEVATLLIESLLEQPVQPG